MNAAFETISAVAVRRGIPAIAVIALIVVATIIVITVIVVIAVIIIIIAVITIVVTVIIVIAVAALITLFAFELSSFLTLMIFYCMPLGSLVVILGICRDVRAE